MKSPYIFSFFNSLSGSMNKSVNVMYFLSRGLNFQEISFLDAIAMLTIFFMEIPTGVLADRFGTICSLTIGALLNAVGLLLIWFEPTYSYILIAHIIIGIGLTCISGAQEAFIANKADSLGLPLNQSFIYNNYYSLVASIIGTLSGALIFDFSKNLTWGIAGLLSIISILPLFLEKKNESIEKEKPTLSFIQFYQDILDGLNIIKNNKYLIKVIFYDSISQFGMTATVKIWQPYFSHLSEVKSYIFLGVISSLFSFVGILSNFYVSKTEKYSDIHRILWSGVFAGVILILCLQTNNLYLAVPLFLIHVFFQMFKEPIISTLINTSVEHKFRARVGSFNSIVGTISEVAGFLFFGFIIDKIGLNQSMLVASLSFIIAPIVLLPLIFKKKLI